MKRIRITCYIPNVYPPVNPNQQGQQNESLQVSVDLDQEMGSETDPRVSLELATVEYMSRLPIRQTLIYQWKGQANKQDILKFFGNAYDSRFDVFLNSDSVRRLAKLIRTELNRVRSNNSIYKPIAVLPTKLQNQGVPKRYQ